jgi:hypothetical protein
VHLSRHPSSSSNDELYAQSRENNSLWYTLEYHKIWLLSWSIECSFLVKVPTGMQVSNSYLSDWKILLSPRLCILRNRPLDYHFLFWLLTSIPQWRLYGLFWVCDRQQGLKMWPLHFCGGLMYTGGFELPITEGQQSFCLINKCTNNFEPQGVVTVSNKKHRMMMYTKNCSCVFKTTLLFLARFHEFILILTEIKVTWLWYGAKLLFQVGPVT